MKTFTITEQLQKWKNKTPLAGFQICILCLKSPKTPWVNGQAELQSSRNLSTLTPVLV